MKVIRAAGQVARDKGLPCIITPDDVVRRMTHEFPELRIVVPMVPPSGNVLRRTYRNPHAYARLRDTWERMIHALMRPSDRKILEAAWENSAKIRVNIHVEHGRLYDKDNLYAGVKPLLDGMRLLHFLYDDSPEYLELEVTQQKSRENQTTIAIGSAKGEA